MMFSVSFGEVILVVISILMVLVFPAVVAWLAQREEKDR